MSGETLRIGPGVREKNEFGFVANNDIMGEKHQRSVGEKAWGLRILHESWVNRFRPGIVFREHGAILVEDLNLQGGGKIGGR